MANKRVVLSDVAQMAGLSKATVSRYLNNSIVLPQQTVQRIENAINTLGYRANSLARRLSMGGSETIGLVLPDIANPFFAELADAAEEAASEYKYSLVLCVTRNNLEKECQFIRWLDTRQVDGLLFTTNRPDNGQLYTELKDQRNVVLIDEDVPGCEVPKVFSDNVHGGELATQALIDAGHRRIAFVGGPDELMSVRERHQGYRHALAKGAIAYDPALVLYGDYDRVFGRQALDTLLALPTPPSAIFAASDYLALGLLDGVRARGLSVPGSLSLVGFDDAIYSDLITPRLSTIRQSARELGRTAVEALIQRLNDDASPNTVSRIPVAWIARDSVSAYPPKP
ncbi:LacI family transcriptional regulator [Rouxiella badensis]|uniref:LacI family DNA-binding transcriptional regulator n=1 Tax=Rouxiella badensis TaxID=1646377 RepID=UPI00037BB82D|nr:LacI family DNA-binding transcriptional regulator [Rouxiella badensis]MCC3718160.1 LacI family transcriptional regulator [Rouxiella badensis]MCC3727072.1 LacI family transcriptional regulator [Rouxiella badensis]MCC3731644.1 LacI family transcriptional regulator [Rouxiella badensis]MCC3738579.1 LacI family transcriptional regulator [Rouxiella badensis]MCC3757033.1 LacI family transcriptional regulator [Rouxiella badensis]